MKNPGQTIDLSETKKNKVAGRGKYRHTECKDAQKGHHGQADGETASLSGRHLGQVHGRGDGQETCAQTREDTREQQQAIDTGGEDLDQCSNCPDDDSETPRCHTAQAIVQIEATQRAEGRAEHLERRDVRLAVGQTRGVILPVGGRQVKVLYELGELDAGTETSLIVTCEGLSVIGDFSLCLTRRYFSGQLDFQRHTFGHGSTSNNEDHKGIEGGGGPSGPVQPLHAGVVK